MKRLIICFGFLFLLTTANAQFFQGFGIMAGGTLGRQNWYYHNPDSKVKLDYLLRYNAEIFAEFGSHPTFRWVTELQYNVKGSKYKNFGPEGETVKYKNQYAAWNNYLMIRKEMFAIIPYVKIGPRAEYVFQTDNNFSKIHFTGAVGAGIEFVAYGPVKFITEAWWVPDVTQSYNAEFIDIKQHAWELRIGIKFTGRTGEACPKVYR